jgi:hypothetical protein
MASFRAPPEMMHRLDAWIAEQPEPRPSRSEAIRRIVAEALGMPAAVETPAPAPALPPPSAAFLRAQEIKELLGEKAP